MTIGVHSRSLEQWGGRAQLCERGAAQKLKKGFHVQVDAACGLDVPF
jgi:hypothetical protein